MEQEEDFSSKTVLVLLIVAIVVSIFGTWAVLEYATSIEESPAIEQPSPQGQPVGGGQVSLTIQRPEPLENQEPGIP